MRHCDHCYEAGYRAGLAAREEPKQSDEPQMVRISLTDNIRLAYGISQEMTEALAMVQGDRIISILDAYRSNE